MMKICKAGAGRRTDVIDRIPEAAPWGNAGLPGGRMTFDVCPIVTVWYAAGWPFSKGAGFASPMWKLQPSMKVRG